MLRTRNEPWVPVRNQRPLTLRGCRMGNPKVATDGRGRATMTTLGKTEDGSAEPVFESPGSSTQ
jgi:hypothetical protein